MPKVNVYLPDELAAAVRDAQIPVSAVCQTALERAVREVAAARSTGDALPAEEASAVGLFARFTPRARKAVALASEAARASAHDFVGTEHVLLGILDEGGSVAVKALATLEIDLGDLRAELRASMPPPSESVRDGHIPFTPGSKRALELTAKEALRLGHNYIGGEHLLLGLLATEDGLASRVLRRMGVELRTTRQAVMTALSGFFVEQSRPEPSPDPGSTPPAQATLDQILQRLDAIERRLPD
jgi:ATP-dependent Clp protease ATP-binding subunit ClpA/post-segregation antitoxin (ccd killing protein)